MTQFKKHKVVMLPTEKISDLFIWERKLHVSKSPQKVNCQHLYFLSDEELKEGDWYLDTDINWVSKYEKGNRFDVEVIKSLKKIIATTDPELKIDTDIFIKGERYKSLPRPSDKFLHKYCELGGIDEVMVEYYEDIYFRYELQAREKLKVALDNTITIKPVVERTYTESEVNALLHSLAQYLRNVVIIEERVKLKTASNEWIKQNL